MIHAYQQAFAEGVVLTLDPETMLSLHGELLQHGMPLIAAPNVARLLAILERGLVRGDLEEFEPPKPPRPEIVDRKWSTKVTDEELEQHRRQ